MVSLRRIRYHDTMTCIETTASSTRQWEPYEVVSNEVCLLSSSIAGIDRVTRSTFEFPSLNLVDVLRLPQRTADETPYRYLHCDGTFLAHMEADLTNPEGGTCNCFQPRPFVGGVQVKPCSPLGQAEMGEVGPVLEVTSPTQGQLWPQGSTSP